MALNLKFQTHPNFQSSARINEKHLVEQGLKKKFDVHALFRSIQEIASPNRNTQWISRKMVLTKVGGRRAMVQSIEEKHRGELKCDQIELKIWGNLLGL